MCVAQGRLHRFASSQSLALGRRLATNFTREVLLAPSRGSDADFVCKYVQDNIACYPPCACEEPRVKTAIENLKTVYGQFLGDCRSVPTSPSSLQPPPSSIHPTYAHACARHVPACGRWQMRACATLCGRMWDSNSDP